MTVGCEKVGQIGYVTLNNPPVNAIGQTMRAGLAAAISWAEGEDLDYVILTGAGRAFAAGADAREFDKAPQEPHLPDVLNALEASQVPWVAAITGVALGGGAEIALACRYRIMAPDARIGFPEVTLGVIPGAGGTQRLPRLIGLQKALEMITLGKPVTAQSALDMGLADEIAEDPMVAARALGSCVLAERPRLSHLAPPDPDQTVLQNAHAILTRKLPHQLAPMQALQVIEDGLKVPFAQGLAAERAAFLDLRAGAQAAALRHVFFAERGAGAPGWVQAEPVNLDKVVVVGGGTMGAGIAYALLGTGAHVILLETDGAACARAESNVLNIVTDSQRRGRIDGARAADIQARLLVTTDYAKAQGAELAIEAAFESMAVKQDVFARLEAALPPHAVLATNTSYLDINEIAASVGDPSRVIGLHFFAPAYVMKLLEIVQGQDTSHQALASGYALAKALGKVAVLSGVCDGFIGNRILARYREEADALLLEGATPGEIDAAMRAFGYAMGPYEAQDLSGLDIAHANRRRQDATRDPARRYIEIADRIVAMGRLGRKTGAGWYDYAHGVKTDARAVEQVIVDCAATAGVQRRPIMASEIENRLILAMVNEAADILHDGIAQSARDIDLVTIAGYGFPRWRGGLMHYADHLGAKIVFDGITTLAGHDPVVWRPSPALRVCVSDGLTLAQFKH